MWTAKTTNHRSLLLPIDLDLSQDDSLRCKLAEILNTALTQHTTHTTCNWRTSYTNICVCVWLEWHLCKWSPPHALMNSAPLLLLLPQLARSILSSILMCLIGHMQQDPMEEWMNEYNMTDIKSPNIFSSIQIAWLAGRLAARLNWNHSKDRILFKFRNEIWEDSLKIQRSDYL